jgi:hypothetical protein
VADRKITDLTALTTPATGDLIPIVDISEAAAADKNKKITVGELFKGVPDGTAAAPSIAFTGSGTDTGIYSPGVDQVAVATNGVERLFVDASGKIGVGSGVLVDTLNVNGSTRIQGADVRFSVRGNAGSSAYIQFSESAVSDKWSFGVSPGDNSLIYKTGANFTGSEKLRITSAGLVGIGTSSPATTLEVSSTFSKIRITDNDNVSAGNCSLEWAFSGGRNGYMGYGASNDLYIWQELNNKIRFGTNATDALTIDSSQRVGIGTTVPESDLHILKSAATPGIILERTTSATAKYKIAAVSGALTFEDLAAAQERARIDSSGRLGIGTSSPGNYHPSYRNLVVGSTSTDSGVTIFSSTTGTGGLIFADGTSANDRIRSSITYSHANDLLNFSVNSGQSALVIDSSRRVGIGTASPGYKCDIDVTGSALRLNSTTTQALLVISSDDAASAKIEFGDESDNDRGAITYDNPNNALIFQANAAERVRIESGGKTKFSGGAYGIERTATAAAFDLNTGNFWTCGAIAIPNPTNQVAGMMGSLRVTAAPTSFAANWKHPGGTYTAPTTFPAVAPFYVQASGTILLGSWTEGIA